MSFRSDERFIHSLCNSRKEGPDNCSFTTTYQKLFVKVVAHSEQGVTNAKLTITATGGNNITEGMGNVFCSVSCK